MVRENRTLKLFITCLLATALFVLPTSGLAQTKISYHSNKFQPADDVKLGEQAAQQVEQQMPIMRDREATDYVSRVGMRLIAALPPEFQHPEFHYRFEIVNAKEINAFALPGGPMFLNRGMIVAAKNEGEMAGVMAHELSHVALRHGTAQATKAEKYSLLSGILGAGGAVLGGPIGSVAQLGAQGVGVYFLKFSREYETEADLLGAQMMARAGYDPHDLANMFHTIEQSGGGGGPSFLSDHPSPKDRYARINQEAQYLPVAHPIKSTPEFERIKARMSGNYSGGRSNTARNGQYPDEGNQYPRDNRNYPNDGRHPNDTRNYPNDNGGYSDNIPSGRVDPPATRLQEYSLGGGVIRVGVPQNWRQLQDSDTSVWFVPEGGYGQIRGQAVYTHGVNFTVTPAQDQNLEAAADQVISGLLQNNPDMRRLDRYNRTVVNGRDWISTRFRNRNQATGRYENVAFFATRLRSGNILFISTVAPQDQAGEFQGAFDRMLNSLRLSD